MSLASDHPTRRILLAGFAAAGWAATGSGPTAAQSRGVTTDIAELMQPGPLGEKALGAADAPVTLIEYASLTCGHCANFHHNSMDFLKEKYIDTGKLRFVFREFPLDPLATAASMLARCASEQRYFPLIDLFFKQQQSWAFSDKPLDNLLAIARQAGFTQESFEACLKNQSVYDGINQVKIRAVEKFGVNSTPTFFLNGQKLTGALLPDALSKAIDPLLATR